MTSVPIRSVIPVEKTTNKRLRLLILTALFAAMTFALTFSVRIPMPSGGYIHLGDAMIYLSACILPFPYAIVSAGIGGALSDLAGGYAIYIIPTLIIKALNASVFTAKKEKILTLRNGLCCIASGAITVAAYYVVDVIMIAMSGAADTSFLTEFFSAKNWIASAGASIPGNLIQAAGSAILFVVIAFALDKAKIKQKLPKLLKI